MFESKGEESERGVWNEEGGTNSGVFGTFKYMFYREERRLRLQ